MRMVRITGFVIASVLWMCFIFHNSSIPGTASNETSSSVASMVQNNGEVNNILNETPPVKKVYNKIQRKWSLNVVIRKNAHIFEFLVLGFLVTVVFFSCKIRTTPLIIYTLFVCLLYAVLDEFHQSFVPLRTSLVSDVLFDFGGCIAGLAIFGIVYYSRLYFIYRRAGKRA